MQKLQQTVRGRFLLCERQKPKSAKQSNYSWADPKVVTALKTQTQQHHYRMQLPASTARMGEWLHSLAAKTTDEKGKPPPSTTQKTSVQRMER